MKKRILFTIAAIIILFTGCKKDDESLPVPSDLANVTLIPRVGGITVKWDYPEDSAKTFLVQVRFQKNGRTVTSNASIYSDSVYVDGLINKLDYTFDVQPFNRLMQGGKLIISPTGKPIRRSIVTIYEPENKTVVPLTADMIATYTQESSEGPKENLVDGDINTYWHSAWSGNTAPLPHYIQITFSEPTKIGGIRYYFRQNNNAENERPNKWDLQTSEDGSVWTTVWVSRANLPVSPTNAEQILPFDKNYISKYFRVRILANQGMKTYTHLGEFAVFSMGERVTDLEQEAEVNYK